MHKKLYKSDTNKVLDGVIGGIGEYFDTDPTILRLGFILITIATGVIPAVIAYIIAMVIVPRKSEFSHKEATYTETSKQEAPKSEPAPETPKEEPKTEEAK